jgi:hypothetical protein
LAKSLGQAVTVGGGQGNQMAQILGSLAGGGSGSGQGDQMAQILGSLAGGGAGAMSTAQAQAQPSAGGQPDQAQAQAGGLGPFLTDMAKNPFVMATLLKLFNQRIHDVATSATANGNR